MIIDIVFRILNFLIIVGLGGYFFTTKLFPRFIHEAYKKLFEKENILEQTQSIIRFHESAHRHQIEQKKLLDDINQRMNRWHEVRDALEQKTIQNNERNNREIALKRIKQRNEYRAYKLFQIAHEKVELATQEKLQKIYSDVVLQEKYNDVLVSFLKDQS